jgi:DNA-binding transcriptional regulator PaaX
VRRRDTRPQAGDLLSSPADDERWTVLVPRLPADPSRYRVAVWRELRRIGAVQLGQGTWALPTAATTADDVDRIRELVRGSTGEVLVLAAVGFDGPSRDRIRATFDDARLAEWHEFDRECDKCVAEIQREIDQRKFTLAELDEEEQNVERLRRWHRELRVRDRFGAGDLGRMEQRLEECAVLLSRFTDLVYTEIGLT